MNNLDRTMAATRPPEAKFNLWQLLTVIAWLGLHISWVVPAWSLLANPHASGGAWGIFMLIALGSFGLATLLGWFKFKSNPERIVLIIWLLLATMISLRWLVFVNPRPSLAGVIPAFLGAREDGDMLVASLGTIAASIYLWRRGIVGWERWIGPLVVRRSLQRGILIFLLVGLIATFGSNPLPLAAFFLFLFSGLLAMGCARLSAQSHLRGGRGVPFQRSWLLGVGGTALGLLAVSAAVSTLVGGPLARAVAFLLGVTLRRVLDLVLIVLEPIAFLIIRFWNLFLGRIGLTSARPSDVPELNLGEQAREQLELLGTEIQSPAWAADLGKILVWIGVVLGIVLALLILAAILRRRGAGRQWRTAPEVESQDTRSLLHALRELLRPGRMGSSNAGTLQPAGRWLAAARIRMIYLRLLRALARQDLKREPSETPLEYLARLLIRMPGSASDLTTITTAYLRVRYGELPEQEAEVKSVEASWERIRHALRRGDRSQQMQAVP